MSLKIARFPVGIAEIAAHANCSSPSGRKLCKAVFDVFTGVFAYGGALHADEEDALVDEGALPENLWGVNLYPEFFGSDAFIEYDSMINVKPWAGNRSRGVDDPSVRAKIAALASRSVTA